MCTVRHTSQDSAREKTQRKAEVKWARSGNSVAALRRVVGSGKESEVLVRGHITLHSCSVRVGSMAHAVAHHPSLNRSVSKWHVYTVRYESQASPR